MQNEKTVAEAMRLRCPFLKRTEPCGGDKCMAWAFVRAVNTETGEEFGPLDPVRGDSIRFGICLRLETASKLTR